MFPRRGGRQCFPVGAAGDGEIFPASSTGKHYRTDPDGETFISIAPTGKHWHELDGETCQEVVGENHGCSPVGAVKSKMFPRRGSQVPDVSPSGLLKMSGKMLPRRACDFALNPTGKHFPEKAPSATPTGKHVRKCFPVGVTPRGGNISDLATGEHFPLFGHNPDGETFSSTAPTGQHFAHLGKCFPVGAVTPKSATGSTGKHSSSLNGETYFRQVRICFLVGVKTADFWI